MTACNTTSIAATTVVGCIVVYLINDGRNDTLTIRAILTLLWPIVILSMLEPADRTNVAIVLPTLWMGIMWWIDSYAIIHATQSTEVDSRTALMGVRFDSHTVTAMSFGLCGLVGARYDTKYTHFILYALMTCIMFVLPVHNLPDSDPLTDTVNEIQRMCLVYSIALVITGVVLTRSTKAPST